MQKHHTNKTTFKKWIKETSKYNGLSSEQTELHYYFSLAIELMKKILTTCSIELGNDNLKQKILVVNGSKLSIKQTLDDFKCICIFLEKKLKSYGLNAAFAKQKYKNLNILNFMCQYESVVKKCLQQFSIIFVGSNSKPSSGSDSAGSSGGVAKNKESEEEKIFSKKEFQDLVQKYLANKDFASKMGKDPMSALASAVNTISKNMRNNSDRSVAMAKNNLNFITDDRSGRISNELEDYGEFIQSNENTKHSSQSKQATNNKNNQETTQSDSIIEEEPAEEEVIDEEEYNQEKYENMNENEENLDEGFKSALSKFTKPQKKYDDDQLVKTEIHIEI